MKNDKQVNVLKAPQKSGAVLFRKFSAVFLMLMLCLSVFGQGAKIKVSGVVSDNTGETLIGASVAEKGTTNAVMTGMDGDYALTVPSNAVLVVTYVGFDPQEIPVNGKTKIDIVLKEDALALEEVVVTALGIKRDKKSLGYALQEVKGDQLTETRDPNVANALSGKVAGLQVKQSGTGPAGSSRIVLRGVNSIGGNNQPLVVVDGVPIDSSTGGSDDFWGNRAVDKGSGMADISPDDIESMSVLKGPAAAALYGSRAGNGVIMITTKKGSAGKGLGISYNSNIMIENPMQTPKYQNTYGQGINGKYASNEAASWGEKMTGQKINDLAGNPTTYSSGDNKLSDFLRTGTTWTNSLDLSKGFDKGAIRLGVMNLSNKGVIPNSSFGRTSVTLRGNANLSDKLSFDAKITYVNQKTENRVKLGGDPDNIFYNYLLMPRSVHFSDLGNKSLYPGYAFPQGTKVGDTDLSGKPVSWTGAYDGKIRNPYWAAYKNTNDDKKNRLLGFSSLKYEFTDWLNIQGRYGMDYYSYESKDRLATGTPYWYSEGDLIMNKQEFYEVNTDFLLTFNKQLSSKVGLVATAGGNIMYTRTDNMRGQANGLILPNFFVLQNGKNQTVENKTFRHQINSLYATASVSYDNTLYLDLTARNDWSSTLNKDNQSYFYPSVSASWLITESLNKWNANLGFIDYAKLRASWAKVGNDAGAYQLLNYMPFSTNKVADPVTGEIITQLVGNRSDTEALFNLKNETVESYEFGLEFKALKNRIGVDFAFYNKDAKNQILKMNVSPTDGVGRSYKYVNAGNVRNRGVELLLTGIPVQTKNFQWDVTLNFSKNTNKIVELAEGVDVQYLNDPSISGMLNIVAEAGGAYGDIWGKAYRRDAKSGKIIVNEKGLPVFGDEYVKLGNNNPNWMAGLNNAFKFKDFDLAFQIDMRYGGDVYMGSIKAGTGAGTLEMTESGRESMLVDGVFADGTPNNVSTTAQEYWSALQGGAEPWIYDATNIRFRELSFGYSFPKKLLAKSPLKSVKLSFVARNLFMIYSKTKGFDPEAGFSTGNAQGFEYASMPTLRSFGFNLNVNF
jgi:TonB-linked SusC/RagA family outer membrane protein